MRRVSKKRAAAMRIYIKRRNAFLAAASVCEFPLGCDRPAVVLHHRRGRFGARLLDEEWWSASCHEHNEFAETQTGAALECGWLVRIEGVA